MWICGCMSSISTNRHRSPSLPQTKPKPPALSNDSAKGAQCDSSFYRCGALALRTAGVPTQVLTHTRHPDTHITRISIIPGLHALCRGESGRVSCLPVYKQHTHTHTLDLSLSGATMTRNVCCLLDGWQWPWRRRRRRRRQLEEIKRVRHTAREKWKVERRHTKYRKKKERVDQVYHFQFENKMGGSQSGRGARGYNAPPSINVWLSGRLFRQLRSPPLSVLQQLAGHK